MGFKEEHQEFQELVRELILIRRHNLMKAIEVIGADEQLTVEEKRSLVQQQVTLLLELPHMPAHVGRRLLVAEAALVLITLERFVRVVLGSEATDEDTLPNLLEKVTSERLRLLRLPAPDRALAIKQIKDVRNTILHGNYEQAARQAGCASVPKYFKEQFTPEVERLYQLTNRLVAQIDPATGKPIAPSDAGGNE